MYHVFPVAYAAFLLAAGPAPGVLPDVISTNVPAPASTVAPPSTLVRATERATRTDLGVKDEGLNVTLPLAPSKTETFDSGGTRTYWFETGPFGPLVFTVWMKRSEDTTAVARALEHAERIRRYVKSVRKAGCGNVRRKDSVAPVRGRGVLPPAALRITCVGRELLVHFYSGVVWNLTVTIAAEGEDLADHAKTISDVVESIRVP